MSVAVDILHLFPDLVAIRGTRLQDYCDVWLRRPLAQKYGIAQITVDEQLMMRLNVDSARVQFVEDTVTTSRQMGMHGGG